MLKGFTHAFNYPYTIGVLLAINAISDAYLLLDAPDCAFWKSGFIQGSHDWNSTLMRVDGFHRIHVSSVNTKTIVGSRVEDLSERLRRIAAAPGCGAVFAVGFPMITITGLQFDPIWKGLNPKPEKPFISVPGGAMMADWLNGYANTLLAIARHMELPAARPKHDHVGIVGYMMDRNENDHIANLGELRRLLAAMGLNLVSVWPSGSPLADMRSIATAGTILSFPHAREAAVVVARRLDVPLVVCDLPFGLDHTARWLLQVGEACGRRDAAESLIENENRRIVPRLEWVVRDILLHKKAVFEGDPVFIRPLARFLEDVGAGLVRAVAITSDKNLEALGPWDDLPFPVVTAHSGVIEEQLLGDAPRQHTIHFAIGGRFPFKSHDGSVLPTIALGYPSFMQHALHESPFLGFNGSLCFLDRVVNGLLRHSAMELPH